MEFEYVPNFEVDMYDDFYEQSQPDSPFQNQLKMLKSASSPSSLGDPRCMTSTIETPPRSPYNKNLKSTEYIANVDVDMNESNGRLSKTFQPQDENNRTPANKIFRTPTAVSAGKSSRLAMPEKAKTKRRSTLDSVEYIPNFDVDMYNSDDLVSEHFQPKDEVLVSVNNRLETSVTGLPADPQCSTSEETISIKCESSLGSVEYIPNFNVDMYNSDDLIDRGAGLEEEKPSTTTKKSYKTPVNASAPPTLSINAQFSMKVLKTQAITPMPNYQSMQDTELNDHLNCYGIRPMGRKRAIEELTRIYETTHPIIDDTKTPTRERVWSTICECADRQPKKSAASRKRPAPPEFNENQKLEPRKPATLEVLTTEVLRWLRLPENADLYRDCLALKSIMLERLLDTFGPLLLEKSISKEAFTRILDNLHITYSDKREESNHYYH